MRQKRKAVSRIIRRLKFYIPLDGKEILVRARTIEEAMMIFDRYHGDRTAVDLTKVRKEVVKFIDTIEKGEGQFARNNSMWKKKLKKVVKIEDDISQDSELTDTEAFED